MEKYNNDNILMKVIKYNTAHDIDVQFENGEIVHNTQWQLFERGSIRQPENRVGIYKNNSEGDLMKVIEYNSSSDVVIEFQDKYKYICKTYWKHFKNGCVKNPYHPNKYGGIVGTNKDINETDDFCISTSKEYNAWFNILTRCFNKNVHAKENTYKNCTICKEWMCFWNFYKWIINQENYVQWKDNDDYAIDKDILIKGNKFYSPKTCVLVPKSINNLLVKHDKRRGKYPIGVTKRKVDGMFEAQCRNPIDDKYYTLGLYNSPYDAFVSYKQYKEKIIKKVAKEEFENNKITLVCYNALINYNVEITD